jgi:fibronectin-binding autotransporter adhesin
MKYKHKLKKVSSLVVATFISFSSLLILVPSVAHAATKTWNGGTDTNYNFSDDENWAGGSAPVAGDDLVFPANVTIRDAVNDLQAGTSFNSIAFTGTAASASMYSITGNAFTLVAGVSDTMDAQSMIPHVINNNITLSANQTFGGHISFGGTINAGSYTLTLGNGNGYLSLGGVVSGSGAIVVDNPEMGVSFGGTNTFTGSLTIDDGVASNEATNKDVFNTFSSITINDGGAFSYDAFDAPGTGSSVDFSVPITVGGTGSEGQISPTDALNFFIGGGGGGPYTINLTGPLTLTSNVVVNSSPNITVRIKGALTGTGFTLSPYDSNVQLVNESSSNTSATPGGTQVAKQIVDTPIAESDKQPNTSVYIYTDHTLTIDGERGAVVVSLGAKLMGTGKVGTLTVGGTVAPGHSPGCLNSGNFNLTGVYQAELGGTTVCSEYDQLKVAGTVTLDAATATLTTSLYNGFKPQKNNTFTIIDNDGTDAVTGTFKGLAEGATFAVDGNTFKISYKGGDGNDVVLTVLVAGTPNSGFSLTTANPVLTIGLATLAAGALYTVGRRYGRVYIKF